jgi:hypothetical protein
LADSPRYRLLCESVFPEIFHVLVLSVQLRSGRILDERLLAHPQRDLQREKPALYPLATWRLRMLMGNKEEGLSKVPAAEQFFCRCAPTHESLPLLSALYNQPKVA